MQKKILIVDDEPDFHFRLKGILERQYGYIVKLISDPNTALALVDILDYDLILCDYVMFPYDGRYFIAQLKKIGFTNKIYLFTLKPPKQLVEMAIPEEYILNKYLNDDFTVVRIIVDVLTK